MKIKLWKWLILILVIIALIVVIYFVKFDPAFLGLPVYVEKNGIELKFSSSRCDKDLTMENVNKSISGEWLDDGTLRVKSVVFINCAERVKRGDFEIADSKIILSYFPSNCKLCTFCVCGNEITYQFTGLERKDYSFELKKIYE